MLEQFGGRISVDELDRLPLLHMGNYDDWTRWLAVGGRVLNAQRGIVFSNMYLVLSAAISGLGIAIGDNLTCRNAVRQGQLVMPFDYAARSIESYYLVSETDILERPLCRVFRDWIVTKIDNLKREMAASQLPEDAAADAGIVQTVQPVHFPNP